MIDDWTLNIENILNSWRGMQCRCMQTNTKTWYENRKKKTIFIGVINSVWWFLFKSAGKSLFKKGKKNIGGEFMAT